MQCLYKIKMCLPKVLAMGTEFAAFAWGWIMQGSQSYSHSHAGLRLCQLHYLRANPPVYDEGSILCSDLSTKEDGGYDISYIWTPLDHTEDLFWCQSSLPPFPPHICLLPSTYRNRFSVICLSPVPETQDRLATAWYSGTIALRNGEKIHGREIKGKGGNRPGDYR